eukprot:scaffold123858_cov20-Tisochrysis_lutea.AAC.1
MSGFNAPLLALVQSAVTHMVMMTFRVFFLVSMTPPIAHSQGCFILVVSHHEVNVHSNALKFSHLHVSGCEAASLYRTRLGRTTRRRARATCLGQLLSDAVGLAIK